MKRVLLIGAPRSGSTWLGVLLSQHSQVITAHHTVVFPYLLAMHQWTDRLRSSYITGLDDQAPDEKRSLSTVIDEADLDLLLAPAATGMFDMIGKASPNTEVVIDKTPENVRMLDSILRVLPDAYVLHVVRDPRSVFSSQRRASLGWAGRQFPSRPHDFAQLWSSDVQDGRACQATTNHYLEVRYEDLLADGANELAGIFEWLDMEVSTQFCSDAVKASGKDSMRSAEYLPKNFVSETSGDQWGDEFSASELQAIETTAGDAMKLFGYQTTTSPRPQSFSQRRHQLARKGTSLLDRILTRLRRSMYLRTLGRNPQWKPEVNHWKPDL